jgi:hypothetical protein
MREMDMSDDLVKRLWKGVADTEQQQEAADRIEVLETERRSLALDLLSAQGQAEEAHDARLKAEYERDKLREVLQRLMMARAALVGCKE